MSPTNKSTKKTVMFSDEVVAAISQEVTPLKVVKSVRTQVKPIKSCLKKTAAPSKAVAEKKRVTFADQDLTDEVSFHLDTTPVVKQLKSVRTRVATPSARGLKRRVTLVEEDESPKSSVKRAKRTCESSPKSVKSRPGTPCAKKSRSAVGFCLEEESDD